MSRGCGNLKEQTLSEKELAFCDFEKFSAYSGHKRVLSRSMNIREGGSEQIQGSNWKFY